MTSKPNGIGGGVAEYVTFPWASRYLYTSPAWSSVDDNRQIMPSEIAVFQSQALRAILDLVEIRVMAAYSSNMSILGMISFTCIARSTRFNPCQNIALSC